MGAIDRFLVKNPATTQYRLNNSDAMFDFNAQPPVQDVNSTHRGSSSRRLGWTCLSETDEQPSPLAPDLLCDNGR